MAKTPETTPGRHIPEFPEEQDPELWSKLTDEQREAMMRLWSMAAGGSIKLASQLGEGDEAWDELHRKLGL